MDTRGSGPILLAITSISVICTFAFGALTLFIYFDNRAASNSDSASQDCDTCVSKLDLSLKVLTDLGEALANHTKVSEYSTSSSSVTVNESWAQIPKYKWD